MQNFCPNIAEGVAESWAGAEVSWREVNGAGWRLNLVGWRCMELAGGVCTV